MIAPLYIENITLSDFIHGEKKLTQNYTACSLSHFSVNV